MSYTYPISAGVYALTTSSTLGAATAAGGTATVKWAEYRTTADVGGYQDQNLPAAVPGLRYIITQGGSTAVRLVAGDGDVFKNLAVTEIFTDRAGDRIEVWCLNSGIWSWEVEEDRLSYTPETVTTSGTGEQDLMSSTLPRYCSKKNAVVRVEAAGVCSGTITLKFYMGAQNITIFSGVLNSDWVFTVTLVHYADDEHRCLWRFTDGITGTTSGYHVFTEDVEASCVCIKLTSQALNPAHYTTQYMFVVRGSGGPARIT